MPEGDYIRHAVTALQVYLERGAKAVELLESGAVEEALEVLQWRKAAFHNLQVHDAKARTHGLDLVTLPEAQSIWIELKLLEEKLRDLIVEAKNGAEAEASKIGKSRKKIRAYKSGQAAPSKFALTA